MVGGQAEFPVGNASGKSFERSRASIRSHVFMPRVSHFLKNLASERQIPNSRLRIFAPLGKRQLAIDAALLSGIRIVEQVRALRSRGR